MSRGFRGCHRIETTSRKGMASKRYSVFSVNDNPGSQSMCRAVLDKRLHTFPCLGDVFVIQLPEIHNVTLQLNNFSRGIILPYKSIFAFTPRIDTVLGKRL